MKIAPTAYRGGSKKDYRAARAKMHNNMPASSIQKECPVSSDRTIKWDYSKSYRRFHKTYI